MKINNTKSVQANLSLDRYIKEIAKNKVLSAEEEIDLMKRIRNGDKSAFEKMVKCNLKFVVKVANQYSGQGLPADDLINEGNLGLIRAIEKFDETRGYKFISYAVWWIRQAILQALSEQSRMIRIPGNRIDNISRISKAINEFESEFQRIPTNEEIAQKLNMKIDDVITAGEYSFRSMSLNSPVNSSNEDFGTLLDIIPDTLESLPDKSLLDQSLKEHLRMSLNLLNEKEALVIRFYFGIDRDTALTLEEIGEMLQLTRERIRQIKERALKKLRHASKCKHLLLS
ncbi:MAG: RNA polymerase sigma factor RpoD/SigA [Bacillota bacterium]